LCRRKKIEVYREPAAGGFGEKKVLDPGGRLKCAAVPEFVVDLEALFSK
jgi:hypothetical protein